MSFSTSVNSSCHAALVETVHFLQHWWKPFIPMVETVHFLEHWWKPSCSATLIETRNVLQRWRKHFMFCSTGRNTSFPAALVETLSG
jgi:hypothetical protein